MVIVVAAPAYGWRHRRGKGTRGHRICPSSSWRILISVPRNGGLAYTRKKSPRGRGPFKSARDYAHPWFLTKSVMRGILTNLPLYPWMPQ